MITVSHCLNLNLDSGFILVLFFLLLTSNASSYGGSAMPELIFFIVDIDVFSPISQVKAFRY